MRNRENDRRKMKNENMNDDDRRRQGTMPGDAKNALAISSFEAFHSLSTEMKKCK